MLEQLKQMNAELERLKAKHLEMSKVMFSDVCKELFERHNLLKSFGWRQYTPYFNDGDECTFSAHTSDPTINGYDEYTESIDDGAVNLLVNCEEFISKKMENQSDLDNNELYCIKSNKTWYKNAKIGGYGIAKNPDYNPEYGSVISDVKEFLDNLDESVLRNMFGDHVRITVTRDGVDVEDYDHD